MPLKIQFHSSSFLCPYWTFGETDSGDISFQGIKWCCSSIDSDEYSWEFFLLHNFSLSLRLISLIILFPMLSDTGQSEAENRVSKFNLKQKKVSKMSSSNHSCNSPVLGRAEIYSNEPRRPITNKSSDEKTTRPSAARYVSALENKHKLRPV